MLPLRLLLLLSLTFVVRGFGYDDILRDECFKKTFRCEDHRLSITEDMEHYVTDPEKFEDICRRHNDFISCINEALVFCTEIGNITSFARMTLDNRVSMGMFCKEPQWTKDYFANVPCINKYEKMAREECNLEEKERVENRPFWCQIPEPCVGMKRIFDCSVEKMKHYCGFVASEVYRRLYYLKVEKQDVLCEFRIRNTRLCQYSAPPREYRGKHIVPKLPKIEKRTGHITPSIAEEIINLITLAIIPVLFIMEPSDKFPGKKQSENLKNYLWVVNKMLEAYQPHLETESDFPADLDGRNEKDEQGSKFRLQLTINELLGGFCWDWESDMECYRRAGKEQSQQILENRPWQARYIKDSIILLYDMLKSEDSDVINVKDGSIRILWRNLDRFPVQKLSCNWEEISSKKVFQCDFTFKYKYQPSRRYLKFSEGVYSNLELNKGPTVKPADSTVSIEDLELSVQSAKDNTEFLVDLYNAVKEFKDALDTHETRKKFSEINLNGDVSKEFKSNNIELKDPSLNSEVGTNPNAPFESDYFVITGDQSSTEPMYYNLGDVVTENLHKSTSEQNMENSEFNLNLAESLGVNEDFTSAERKEKFQVREVEDFLNERFTSGILSESQIGRPDLVSKLAKNYSLKDCLTETSSPSIENSADIRSTDSLKLRESSEDSFAKSYKQSNAKIPKSGVSSQKNLESTNLDSERVEL